MTVVDRNLIFSGKLDKSTDILISRLIWAQCYNFDSDLGYVLELDWDLFDGSFGTRLGEYKRLVCCYWLILIEEAFKIESRVLERINCERDFERSQELDLEIL